MSALVESEIFRPFVNTLTPDDKYSRRNIQIFWQKLERLYLKKEWLYMNFLLHLYNVHET